MKIAGVYQAAMQLTIKDDGWDFDGLDFVINDVLILFDDICDFLAIGVGFDLI